MKHLILEAWQDQNNLDKTVSKIKYHLPEYEKPDDFLSLLLEVGFREVVVKNEGNYVAFVCRK